MARNNNLGFFSNIKRISQPWLEVNMYIMTRTYQPWNKIEGKGKLDKYQDLPREQQTLEHEALKQYQRTGKRNEENKES